MNDRASTDSQVFEMIHLDENNEEVSSKDKIVTGSESDGLIVINCNYLLN